MNSKTQNGVPVVQSLWIGEITTLEAMCITSYISQGHEFHLYTYEKLNYVPKGCIIKDGNDIMSKDDIFTLKGDYLPFSDIFRYKMLYENGGYWVDLDMICLKLLDFKEDFIFSSERTIQKGAYKMKEPFVANIGVLKAPQYSSFYKELYEKCLKHSKRNTNKDKIKYMRFLRQMIKKYNYENFVKSPASFCPVDWWNTREIFKNIKYYPLKYGVEGYPINRLFLDDVYSIHIWRSIAKHKKKLDFDKKYPQNSLYEILKRKTLTEHYTKTIGFNWINKVKLCNKLISGVNKKYTDILNAD